MLYFLMLKYRKSNERMNTHPQFGIVKQLNLKIFLSSVHLYNYVHACQNVNINLVILLHMVGLENCFLLQLNTIFK